MIKRFLILGCVIWSVVMMRPLNAQYNELQILTQQAHQQMAQRQYAAAEQTWLSILQRFPQDANSAVQLIQLYYALMQLDKAEQALIRHQSILPQHAFTELNIQLAINQGRGEAAYQMVLGYLTTVNHDLNQYRLIASYFERRGFFDIVLRLYDGARKQMNNDNLFMLETANTALNYRLYERAVNEYLRFLETNPGNLYFISNQLKSILSEDPEMIRVVADHAARHQNPILREVHALALMHVNDYLAALDIYKTLTPDKVRRFAEDQFIALNDEVALLAYEHLAQTTADTVQKAEHLLRLAHISYRGKKLVHAREYLLQIIDSSNPQSRHRNRMKVNYDARKLMAEISLADSKSTSAAVDWYRQAAEFTHHPAQRQEIDLDIARLYIINNETTQAAALLRNITEARLIPSKEYYYFLIALMNDQTGKADTLMNEYIIRHPASPYVNDAIYQMMLVFGLKERDRPAFYHAYRLRQMMDVAAVDSLVSLFKGNGEEELLILAAEWAVTLSDIDKALDILDFDWQDGITAEYAVLMKVRLVRDREYELRLAREFLKNNPNSIFSPNLRQVIGRIGNNRPNL